MTASVMMSFPKLYIEFRKFIILQAVQFYFCIMLMALSLSIPFSKRSGFSTLLGVSLVFQVVYTWFVVTRDVEQSLERLPF